MKEADANMCELTDNFEQVCCFMPNNRKTRTIIKSLGKHINALAYMHPIEKDANKKGYIYFATILHILAKNEEDEELLMFLDSIYSFINKIKKNNFILYREFGKENKEALLKLEELDFATELKNITESNNI